MTSLEIKYNAVCGEVRMLYKRLYGKEAEQDIERKLSLQKKLREREGLMFRIENDLREEGLIEDYDDGDCGEEW